MSFKEMWVYFFKQSNDFSLVPIKFIPQKKLITKQQLMHQL